MERRRLGGLEESRNSKCGEEVEASRKVRKVRGYYQGVRTALSMTTALVVIHQRRTHKSLRGGPKEIGKWQRLRVLAMWRFPSVTVVRGVDVVVFECVLLVPRGGSPLADLGGRLMTDIQPGEASHGHEDSITPQSVSTQEGVLGNGKF
jgi:hypothetical protein